MNKSFMAVALLLLLAACPAWATVPPKPSAQGQSADPADEAGEMVQQGFTEIRQNDIASGQALLDKAIQAEGFARLPGDVRYRALYVASLVAQQTGQNEKAHDIAVRATAFDEADETAWMTRLSTAFLIGDYRDAGHSQAIFAERWPEKLDTVNPEAIWQLHGQLKQAHDSDVDREMLDALFDAKWQDQGVEPSDLWRDLALLHLERKGIARATTVALRITSGQTVLSMLVDKRFDPVTLQHPQAFDVDRLIASQIKAAESQVQAHPDQLRPVTDLQELYLITRQYARVLAISEAAVAHAGSGDGPKTYTDFADRYAWVLDNRSRALTRQAKWDEAVRVEELAARRPEQGAMNVSQLINLGELYAEINQPDKAANALIELGEMSPFGRMQLESVKLRISIAKKDEAAITNAMDYMREHRGDAVATWEDALLLRGELDAAASLLIERLQNPVWRNAALVAMQHYADVTETPVEKRIQDGWNTIVARPDVQAAMLKVGRVEHFNITAQLR